MQYRLRLTPDLHRVEGLHRHPSECGPGIYQCCVAAAPSPVATRKFRGRCVVPPSRESPAPSRLPFRNAQCPREGIASSPGWWMPWQVSFERTGMKVQGRIEQETSKKRSTQSKRVGEWNKEENNRTHYSRFNSFLHFLAILRLRISTLDRVHAEPIPQPKPSAMDAALYVGFPRMKEKRQRQTHEDKGASSSHSQTCSRIYAKAAAVLDPRLLTERIDSSVAIRHLLSSIAI